jgi:hypothetical protein
MSPYHLQLGSDGHKFMGKAIVVNSQSGKHYSSSPIPLTKAKAQKRVLEAAAKEESPTKKKDDPCWKGYEMIGMKMKDGRKVPNCVPQ